MWGSFHDDGTWQEVDELLRTRWRHPHGGQLKIDAACIDASDGDHFDKVLNFCYPENESPSVRHQRPIWRTPLFPDAKGKRIGDKFAMIGVDGLKNVIFDRLAARAGNSLLEVARASLLRATRKRATRRPVCPRPADPAVRAHRKGAKRDARLPCLLVRSANARQGRVRSPRGRTERHGGSGHADVENVGLANNQSPPAAPQPPSSEFRIVDRR